MSEYLEVMFDIETTGKKPGFGIWQVGVATNHGEERIVTINPSSIDAGLFRTDSETLQWQEKNNFEEWYQALHLPTGTYYGMEQLLTTVSDWVTQFRRDAKDTGKEIRFWCKGTDFDFPILEYAFDVYRMPYPWKYYERNDLRTLCNVTGQKVPAFENAHNALVDSQHQLAHLLELLELIKRGTHTSIS